MAKKFQFSYPYASYMDVSLMRETKTKKELLAEYKAMRDEANRRLHGLEKYKWTQASQAYQYNKDRFKGGVSRMTKEQLSKQMREAAIFLGSQTSTVQGQRRQRDRMLDTFRESWGLNSSTGGMWRTSCVSWALPALTSARPTIPWTRWKPFSKRPAGKSWIWTRSSATFPILQTALWKAPIMPGT